MSKSKLTLIVDGNWLLMSRLSVIMNNYVDDYELCQDLKLKLIKSMNVVLRTFPIIDNIIFVADGGSWRNSIEIPEFIKKEKESKGEVSGYKENRIRSDTFNWDLLFKSYEEFISELNESGITTCREQNIEGDDWCYHWSRFLNSQGTNCIIWTKDNDLKQLVSIDKNKCFTGWWNKENGLFLPNFEEEDFDFLLNNAFNANEQILMKVENSSKSTTKINPMNIVIDKIIRGDAGDNIFPIILRKSKSGSQRMFKVSSKDIKYDLNIDDYNEIYSYISSLLESKSYINRTDTTPEQATEHFLYNKRLILLRKDIYPDEIREVLERYTDYNCSKDLMIIENKLQAKSNKLIGILDLI